MNLGTLNQLVGRLNERTKLILVAIGAFLVGWLFSGHTVEPINGRYVPWPASSRPALLDTRTGEVWALNAESKRFERQASLPYF